MSIRPVKQIVKSQPTLEGAGVKLHRAFGFGKPPTSIRSCCSTISATIVPTTIAPGFPWHPHRGIETITYVLAGTVEHGDSLGNRGAHGRGRRAVDDGGQRHPAPGNAAGRRAGPDARLPALGQPAVVAQDDRASLSGHSRDRRFPRSSTTTARTCASSAATSGASAGRWTASRPTHAISTFPFRRAVARPCRWKPGGTRSRTCSKDRARSRGASQPFGILTEKETAAGETLVRERTGNRSLVLFDSGDEVTVQAGEEGIRFLLISGKPIEEPVAWYGPIVMNTNAEIQQAVTELRNGTFIKHG